MNVQTLVPVQPQALTPLGSSGKPPCLPEPQSPHLQNGRAHAHAQGGCEGDLSQHREHALSCNELSKRPLVWRADTC